MRSASSIRRLIEPRVRAAAI
ncbi:MAG: hypothetical protein JWL99_7061, partial [Streptomyces oryziradicis]|nr:hypothetical protein [Actinacidiphila oryziradicis]